MSKEELFNLLMNVKELPNWDTYDTTGLENGVAIWFDTEEKEEEQKGGAEAGFVAQLLFYPVTEQLFVFNDSQVCRVPAVKKNKKDIDICSNQYYIYIIN